MRRACRPSPAWLRWALPVCAAVLLAPRPTSGQCAGPAFGPVAGPTVSGEPWGVVVGDFWGVTGEPDGTLDVVVTKRSANVVTLLRGDGLGSFMAPIDFAVGTGPTDLVVADFNGDGLLDLAAVVAAQALPPVARVELLAGTGSGFGAPVPLDVVDLPSRLAVGDFNRDDKPDLVVVSWSAETVQVYAGNGALGFNLQAPQPTIPGDTPTAAVAGDFNRDGQPDLAVSLDNVGPGDEVLIYLGDGTGHLGDTPSTEDPFATITVGTTPLDIRAGDVNRDGKPDLVTADLASVAISVLIGAGNGTFTREPGSPAVGAGPIRAVLEDFDRDGLLDVATLNPPGGPPHVTVLPGTAVPPFFDAGSPTTLLLSPASTHEGLAAGDLDADGRPDLVATEGTDGNVVVALNTASPDCPRASFGDAPRAFFAGDGPVSVAVADLDEDGHDDLVSAAYSGNTLEVLRGSGNGYSRSGGVPLPGFPRGVAAADFNVDGHADIVAAFGNQVQLFLGDGTGALVGGSSAGAGTLTSAVVAGDFDGNGTPDVVATSQATGEVYFFPGDALGGLGAARITPVGTGPRALAAGYLNAGGVLDLVVANSGANSVSVLLGNGDGSFSVSTLPMAPGKGPWGIALGSFDGGGTLDIVTADHDASPASVTVWLGAGDGTFGSPTSHTVPGVFPFAVAALDVTDDSNDDITVVTGSDALVLLVGDGGASFAAPVEFPVRTRPSEIAALDADADGRPDLAIPCRDADSVVVLLARPPVAPLFSEATKVAVGANPTDIATADLDRDGDLDLAVANSTGGTVSILRNDSLGAFSVSATPAAGASPAAVVAADFDRDGILDLAVANREDPNGTVSVLRGLGGGAFDTAESAVPFLPPYQLEVLELPDDLAVGDFDSDGSLEIAVVNEAADTVTLIGIDPRVPFPASPPYFDFSFGGTFPVGESPTSIFAADLDRDGNLDLAVANLINVAPPLDDDLTVLFGDGTGDFPDIRNLALSSGTSPLSVTAGDFDLDGDLDLAAAVFGSDEIALFENQGARVFSSPGIAIPASYLPQFLTTADVNRDGKPDLALAASGFAVGRGRCSPPAPCPLGLVFEDSEDFIAGRNSAALVVADLSGDGLPDAALVNKDSDDVSILLSTACVRRRLVVSASPAACGMGAPPFPMTALVEVQDDGANKLICESGTISASIAPGTGPVGAILGGTLDIVVSSGEASFGDLNIDREGPRYRLQFDLSGVPSALSRSFTLGPDIAIFGPPSFCGLSSGAYSVATGYDRYLWTVDGTPASGSPSVLLVNPPLAPSLPQEVGLGPHTLAVGARVDGCLATDSKSIYVGDLASVSITPTGATTVCVDCLGGTVTTAQTGGGAPLGHQWGYRTVPMTGPITSIVGQTGDTYVVNGLDFPGVGIFYLVETTTPTCGSPVTSSNEVAVTITATVPGGEVQSLGATSRGTPGDGQNVLQWVNSVGTPDEIRVRWNKAPTGSTICAPPPDPVTLPVSGERSFSPPFFSTTVWPHPSLELDTAYCYSVFVKPTAVSPFSPGRTVKARPFDTTVGPVKWAYATGATAVAPPTVGYDGVVALSNDRSVHSLERGINGGTWPPAWVPPILNGVVHSRSPIMPMPAPADPLLLVGDDVGELTAINTRTGQKAWGPISFSGAMITGAPGAFATRWGGPADVVLVGTRVGGAGYFYTRDIATGGPIATYLGGGALGPVTSTPVLDYATDQAYFTSWGLTIGTTTVWCVEVAGPGTMTRCPGWTLPDLDDIDASPVLNNGQLYVANNAGDVYSLDATDGTYLPLGTFSTGDGPVKGFLFPDRRGGELYFATETLVWSVTDTAGELSTNWTWDDGPGFKPSIVLQWPGTDFLFVGSDGGKLYQLEISGGRPSTPCTPPSCKVIVLGDGSGQIGAPSLDIGAVPPVLHVGSEAGVVYAVEVPLP